MRFRRALLRSLAPLLSLSALMAAMAAGTGPSSHPQPDARTLARLLRTVADIVAPSPPQRAANHTSIRPSPQSLLSFWALAETPLSRSVWMVASSAPVPGFARRLQLQPLRC